MYQLYFNEKIKIKKDLDQKKRISCIVKKKKKEQKQKQKEIKGQMVEVNVSAQIF